jgi:hypothetical protein
VILAEENINIIKHGKKKEYNISHNRMKKFNECSKLIATLAANRCASNNNFILVCNLLYQII